MGGLVLTTTTALGASVLAAGPAQAAVPQRATLAAAPAAPAAQAATAKATAKQSRAAKQRKRAAYAVKYAAKQIGDPYRYGGTGPGSWDCSGLAGGSWRKAGVKLPRTTQQIYRAVKKKVSWKGAVKGDLLFFYGGRTHMGIYAGHGYMIHAPSSGQRVKKIKLTKYYKRNFSGGVRPGL
ncbi:C40 family peptidase [Actinomadura madurae]|uniref:C40 family peptidase n=1 Tax=Actinomadura madurae TaxID=1993 RepID=UPI0020270171|nr:C40 family peptidase [Actinomadura madurae]MCP9950869.1 C40 family peptidase [Actinomadura madurae]MCP9967653.1 C40 family peptidase [Actinomadura madurae]MCP9980103.1 C40 family peptidase [Actinomadura madurae]MCQ0008369.1 C40 family peptidase [Actinomadura madurae]MCQ0016318.1 C40 family peptidase [Actinomadura madurae]